MSLLERMQKERTIEDSESGKHHKARNVQAVKEDPFEELKVRIHLRIIKRSIQQSETMRRKDRMRISGRQSRG